MICPSCGNEVEFLGTSIAPPLAVCPSCGHTVVVTDGSVRLAVAADTAHLTDDKKIALRKFRPR